MDQNNEEQNPFLKVVSKNSERFQIEKPVLQNNTFNQIVKDDTIKPTQEIAVEEENPFLKIVSKNPEKFRVEGPSEIDKPNILKNYNFKSEDLNPDQETEVVKLAEQFKVSPNLVRDDVEYFKKLNNKTTYDFDKLSVKYPKTTEFLTKDFTNYSLNKNEIDKIKNIEKLEQQHESVNKTYKSFVNVGLASAANSLIEFTKLAFDQAGISAEQLLGRKTFTFSEISQLTDDPDLKTEYAKKLIETRGYKPTWEIPFAEVINTATNYWDKKIEKESKYIPELQDSDKIFDLFNESGVNLKDFEGEKFVDNTTKLGRIIYYNALANLPNTLTGIAGYASGSSVKGLTLMFAGASGQKYTENLKLQQQRQMEQAGQELPISIESGAAPLEGEPRTVEELTAVQAKPLISTEQAITSAYIAGGIEVITEKFLGTFAILKKSVTPLVKTLQKEIGYESTKAVVKEFSKNVLSSAGSGFSEELSANILNDVSDYLLDLQAQPITLTQSIKNSISAGVVGAVMEGGITSPSALIFAANQRQAYKQAQLDKDLLLAVGPEFNNLELREKLPPKHKELVKSLTANGPVQNVYVPVDKFEGFFQKNNDDPTQAAAEIGIVKEYEDAKQTGDLIEIPIEKWINKIEGTPVKNGLINDTKLSPDSKTSNEAKESNENLEANLQEIIKEDNLNQKIIKETNQIQDDIKNKLLNSGVYASDKAAYMALTMAGSYRPRSENVYAGRSPLEIYQSEGLRIEGLEGLPEGMQVFAQADKLSPSYEKNSQIVNASLKEDFTLNDAKQAFKDLTPKEKKALKLESYFKTLNKETSTKEEFLNYLQSKEVLPQADKTKRIKGFFDPVAKFVGLIKGQANLSTFLHEGGHVFLDQIKLDFSYLKSLDPEKLNVKQKAFMERAQTILDFLEVKSFAEIGRDQHEKWARSFEAYLMEGKAPNKKLQKAFKAFADWFLQIYKSIKNLEIISGEKINLTDEIRGVFDSLLAVEEELIKNNKNYPDLIKDLEKSEMSKELVSQYNSAEELINAESSSVLTKIALDNFKKTQTEIYKKKEEEIRQRLFTELVTSRKEQEHLLIIETDPSAENQTPKELAETLNYKNVNEFNKAMAKARVDRDNLELEVKKEMQILYPNMLSDMEALAIFALHNENKRKKLDIEIKYLNDLLIKIPVEESEIIKVKEKFLTRQRSTLINKEEAIKFLSTKNLKDIKPYKFERAERKAASLATKYYKNYFEATDVNQKLIFLGQAFQEKIKQVQNHELYKASYEIREFYNKNTLSIKNRFNKSNKDLSETRNVDYINLGRAIGARFGLLRSDKNAEQYLKNIQRYDEKTYQSFNEILTATTKNAAPIDEIQYKDFVNLVNSLNSLWDLSRSTELQTVQNQKIENIEIIKQFEEVTEDLIKVPKNKKDFFRFKEKHDSFKSQGLSYLARLTRFQQLFRYLDKGNPLGPFTKFIWQRLNDSYVNKASKFEGIKDKYQQYTKEWASKQNKKTINKEIVLTNLKTQIKEYLWVKDPETGLENAKLVTVEEIDAVFNNKLELLMAIAHTGNQSNKSKLLRGYGWGSEFEGVLDSSKWDNAIKSLIADGTLTEDDFDYVQKIWDLTDSLLPDVQKAHKQVEGFYMKTIMSEPLNVTFKDGKTKTYNGGYIPAVIDLNKVTDVKRKDEINKILEDNPNYYKLPTVGKGSTIERIEEYAAPLSLDLALLGNHIDWALSYAYLEPTVRELNSLITNKMFRQLIDKIDPLIYDEIRAWLKRSAIEQTIKPFDKDSNFAFLGDILEYLRIGTVIQYMTFNIGSTAVQITGFSVLLSRLKTKNVAMGLIEYLKGMGKLKFWEGNDLTNTVIEKSAYMKLIGGEFVQSIKEQHDELVLEKNNLKTVLDFANKHKYFFIQTMQNVVSVSGWWAAYNEAIGEYGMNESEAIKFADGVIQTTQGANRAIDISSIENTNKIERFIVQFYSYPNTMYNLLTTESKIAIRKQGFFKATPQLMYLYLTIMAIPGLITVMFYKALNAKEPEKDDEESKELDFFLDFLSNQFQFGTSIFPYFGNISSTLAGAFTEEKYDDKLNMGPTWSALERSYGRGVQRTFKQFKDVYTGEKSIDEVIDPQAKFDILTFVGILTRLPIQPIAKPIKYTEQLEEGTIEEPTSDYDYIRGIITGKGERIQ